MIKESDGIPLYLPALEVLKDCIKKATDWKKKAERILKTPDFPTIDELKTLVVRANAIPVRLDLVEQVVRFVSIIVTGSFKSSSWSMPCVQFSRSTIY